MTRVNDVARFRHNIQSAVQAITDRTIEDLQRRARHDVRRDGFPAATLGDGTSRGTAELTSVEAAADARGFAGTVGWDGYAGVDGQPVPVPVPMSDPVGEVVRELLDILARMDRDASAVIRRLGYLRYVGESARGRVDSTAGDCLCCERNVAGTEVDRLRSGFCDACRKAWERGGRQDRHRFILERRAYLDGQKQKQGA